MRGELPAMMAAMAVCAPPPSYVPSATCLSCEICCRFPEADAPMRPYFTPDEAQAAVAAGMPEAAFSSPAAGRVRLVPQSVGRGWMCPAFEPATSRCKIYEARPLDCRLYPFVVTRGSAGRFVAADRLCPDVERRGVEAAAAFARQHLVPLVPLPAGLQVPPPDSMHLFFSAGEAPSPPIRGGALAPVDGSSAWQALFDGLRSRRPWISAWSAASLEAWGDGTRYHLGEFEGMQLVLAESDGLFFAPVPPLPVDTDLGAGLSDVADAEGFVAAASALLDAADAVNRTAGATRIESLSDEQADLLRQRGWTLEDRGMEYLYERRAVASLAGGAYAGPRADYNRFARSHPDATFETLADDDLPECLALFDRWAAARAEPSGDRVSLAPAHRRALAAAAAGRLGWRGWVVRTGGRVRGYTLGYALSETVFCDFAEVAEPGLPGLSAFLFRELCGSADEFEHINTMGDAGLPGLAASKESWRPWRRIREFATRGPTPAEAAA